MAIYSVITGTGNCIPPIEVKNEDFLSSVFYDEKGDLISTPTEQIIQKFKDITTIESRRYAADNQFTSDLALEAAQHAIESAGIDKEELDYILLAHNFGDIRPHNIRISNVPSVATRLKSKLQINNPFTVAYDTIIGCPGWVQTLIQADCLIRVGEAKKILVVGADILSRISDPHDRDSMIYADGAGAVILEARESDTPVGVLGHIARTDSNFVDMLFLDVSNEKELAKKDDLYIKMYGRKLYQYALENVPSAIKAGLDKCNLDIHDVKKIFIHQANGKMDEAILKRLFLQYGIREIPKDIMPMSISWLGNSSVATVPTLFDIVMRGQMEGQELNSGDIIVFASVGAGMHINAVIYKMP